MDQKKDTEIKGVVDERAEERRVEMRKGIMEGDFGTGDLISYNSTFSGMESPCMVIDSADQDRILLFD
jgi:hypothetical protein